MSRVFGQPAQMGYVVKDVEAGIEQWLAIGVGPWFYVETVETDYFRHRGESSDPQLSIALANSGSWQIELIQQRNEAPSMYREFLDAGNEGFQHISYWSDEYQDLYDRVLSLGYVVGHEGQIGGELGRFAYVEHEKAPGAVIEISDVSGPKGQFFEYIREVASDWDGSEPIRKLN
jgi:hypothetical protein